MFDYYGSKNQLARYYQYPRYDTIIEPFAGSAGYAMYHLERDKSLRAVLCEKSDKVFRAWQFLKTATEKDIDDYPIPKAGDRTSDFFAMASSASNAFLRSHYMTMTTRMENRMRMELKRIKRLLPLMERIEIIKGSYSDIANVEATWFIDPPYQNINGTIRGQGYDLFCNSESIDYQDLATYCKMRMGQVIVCEQEGADWLPFRPFRSCTNSIHTKYTEVLWTSKPDVQMDMFGWDRN